MSEKPKTESKLKLALRITAAVLIVASVLTGVVMFFRKYAVIYGKIYDRDSEVVTINSAEEFNCERLKRFRDPKQIDLRLVELSAEQYLQAASLFENCEIIWSVPFSFGKVDSDITELAVSEMNETDLELLKLMGNLEKIDFSGCDEYELMLEYSRFAPDCECVWSIEINGAEYTNDCENIALAGASAEDIAKLAYLPNLKSVDAKGCDEYKLVYETSLERPECEFEWEVPLAGVLVSSKLTEADISGIEVTDLEALRAGIECLPNLEKLIMCDCGISNEDMDAFNKSIPDVKIVWKVYFGTWSVRTDVRVFSTLKSKEKSYMLRTEDCWVLQYCTDIQMLDLGHNEIDSVEPFVGLTELRVLILADNWLTDISGLKTLQKLEYLELFSNYITDISVCAELKNLTHVNFVWNDIPDPTPLYELEYLEMCWMFGEKMSKEYRKELVEKHPDCIFELYPTYKDGATAGGWRQCETFYKLRRAFHGQNCSTTYEW